MTTAVAERPQEEIADELAIFRKQDAIVADLREKYMGLTIAGINDRKGYEAVHEARMIVKRARVDVEKTRERIKADVLARGRKIDAQANWTPAAAIIDWSLPCPSIFGRKRPLADKTLRRIEIGLRKFCGPGAEPFIVKMRGTNNASSIGQPLPTVTGGGNHEALAVPFQLQLIGRGAGRVRSVDEPLPTIIASRENHGIVQPFIVPQFGERAGQEPRTHSVNEPLPTATSHGAGALVQPFTMMLSHPGDRVTSVDRPLPTITTAKGGEQALVAPFMVDVNHGESERSRGGRVHSLETPLGALSTKNGKSLVLPFLTEYYGTADARSANDPLSTVTCRHRHGLAMVQLVQTMQQLGIVDVGFRMLEPHELAAAQGFPKGYEIYGSKADQVKQIGNSVHTAVAKSLCTSIAEAA